MAVSRGAAASAPSVGRWIGASAGRKGAVLPAELASCLLSEGALPAEGQLCLLKDNSACRPRPSASRKLAGQYRSLVHLAFLSASTCSSWRRPGSQASPPDARRPGFVSSYLRQVDWGFSRKKGRRSAC